MAVDEYGCDVKFDCVQNDESRRCQNLGSDDSLAGKCRISQMGFEREVVAGGKYVAGEAIWVKVRAVERRLNLG